MQYVRNENGAVLVFVTLMIVLLFVMVGMGLDTGHLAYIRSQGQPAVDAAALAAASAIPTNDPSIVKSRAAKFNYGGGNPGTGNNYLNSPNNLIGDSNVNLIRYDKATNTITQATGVTSTSVGNANGARAALESTNPYGGTTGAPMNAPLFLTPLFNLMGIATAGTANVNVTATAIIQAIAALPIAVIDSLCGTNATLDFHGGGANTAGWTTYYVENASADEIRGFFESLAKCEGQPAVETGFCTNLSNGVIGNLFNTTIPNLYSSNPAGTCYLIPVVAAADQNKFNQCTPITDWAKFCPDETNPFPGQGQLKGTVTCGQSPYASKDTKCYVPKLVRDTPSGM
jgi:Putative Flp pilus-assembly TadE/G-like